MIPFVYCACSLTPLTACQSQCLTLTDIHARMLLRCLPLLVFHLPNRAFYPQLQDMTEARLVSTMQSVILYGALEMASLVLLC